MKVAYKLHYEFCIIELADHPPYTDIAGINFEITFACTVFETIFRFFNFQDGL